MASREHARDPRNPRKPKPPSQQQQQMRAHHHHPPRPPPPPPQGQRPRQHPHPPPQQSSASQQLQEYRQRQIRPIIFPPAREEDENYKCCFGTVPWGYRDRCAVSLCMLALLIMGMAALVFETIIPGVHKLSVEVKNVFHPPPDIMVLEDEGVLKGSTSLGDNVQNVKSKNP